MLILVILAVVLATFYGIYVSVIKKKNNIKEAASGIDVQLNKRYDLIPNMLKIAAKFMEHEKEVFMAVSKYRESALNAQNMAEKFEADNKLVNAMHNFIARAEEYPELKSDVTMSNAQQAMAEVEEHIAAARRFYNSAVKEYKNALEIFPSSIVAKMIGLKDEYPFYEADEVVKERIDAKEFL
ncbi:MAG: LemA family protein [Alphaproteobacteria bacterium]|nr:LemA family protein [Alphaproteobacteria bacterium]